MDQTIGMIFLGGVLMNNCALQHFFGAGTLLGDESELKKSVWMGLSVTVVLTLTALLAWPVQNFLLAPCGLEYFRTLAFVLLTALVSGLTAIPAKKLSGCPLNRWLLLTALNGAVLGSLLVHTAEGLSFLQFLAACAAGGLGFLLALAVFAGLRTRIEERYVPAPFRGLPIRLLTAAIFSMALLAF